MRCLQCGRTVYGGREFCTKTDCEIAYKMKTLEDHISQYEFSPTPRNLMKVNKYIAEQKSRLDNLSKRLSKFSHLAKERGGQ